MSVKVQWVHPSTRSKHLCPSPLLSFLFFLSFQKRFIISIRFYLAISKILSTKKKRGRSSSCWLFLDRLRRKDRRTKGQIVKSDCGPVSSPRYFILQKVKFSFRATKRNWKRMPCTVENLLHLIRSLTSWPPSSREGPKDRETDRKSWRWASRPVVHRTLREYSTVLWLYTVF